MTEKQMDLSQTIPFSSLFASPRWHSMQRGKNHDCICKYGAISVLSSGTIDDFE